MGIRSGALPRAALQRAFSGRFQVMDIQEWGLVRCLTRIASLVLGEGQIKILGAGAPDRKGGCSGGGLWLKARLSSGVG